MANPSLPSRAPRNAPQSKAHQYIGALVADDFGRLSALTISSANTFARKKLDTASQSLQLRNESREKAAHRAEAREYAAAERGLQAELRESDHRIRMMWRSLKTKMRPEKKLQHTPPRERTRLWPFASVALPKYDGPVIDRQGHRGVFVRMRYNSRRTAEQGVSQRLVRYVFNGAECDVDGQVYQTSNVGLTIDETLCAFDHLEQVNWSAAKNAKLMMHGIFAVDYRQTTDQMMECGKRWAEDTLGRFDLPYLVTLHAPPPDGDERNWHLHILWSFRPMVRTGDHQWDIAEMLRTDLDNPAAMKVFREMYAHVMTDVSFEAGQRQVYTANTNAARGLPHEPQTHLGGAKTNRARGGEYVADNEENHERVQRSKAAALDDDLRHADEAIAREQTILRSITERWARLPSLPMRVPEPAMAATISASLPDVGTVPARSSVTIVVPAAVPALRAEPARAAGELAITRTTLCRAAYPDLVTPQAAQSSRLEIANLRNGPIPRVNSTNVPSIMPPTAPARPALMLPLPQLPLSARRALGGIAQTPPLPVRVRVAIPAVPALSSTIVQRSTFSLSLERSPGTTAAPSNIQSIPQIPPPPALADSGTIERIFRRLDEAWKADEARRKREREKVERATRLAEAAKAEQEALESLLNALEEERHYLAVEQGRPVVDAEMLSEFNVSADALRNDAVQARLGRIVDRNDGEVVCIHEHVTRRPDHLSDDGGYWTLSETAPPDLRALVLAWRNDRTVQAALARVAATTRTPVTIEPANAAKPTQTTWRGARHLRMKAMADWDPAERRERSDVILPGGGIVSPAKESDVDRPAPARRSHGLPGSEIGD